MVIKMKVAMINGSPKTGESNTEKYLKAIQQKLGEETTIYYYNINRAMLKENEIEQILTAKVLLIAFPLYVDGIPSHLLQQMIQLEEEFKASGNKDVTVYALVNNGFNDGSQNQYAIEMVRAFCKRAGLIWGQGIGIGAGEMIGGQMDAGMKLGETMLTSAGKAIDQLVDNIHDRRQADAIYTQADFPDFAFKFMANHTFWNANMKKNGVKVSEAGKRLTYKESR